MQGSERKSCKIYTAAASVPPKPFSLVSLVADAALIVRKCCSTANPPGGGSVALPAQQKDGGCLQRLRGQGARLRLRGPLRYLFMV